jgi:hypothetical protein
MAPLIDLVSALRRLRPDWAAPDLDPASGGAEARALFLLEKPGPKTAPDRGSGFVSVHNDDATAAAIYAFALVRNRLPLGRCLFANAIPWWDGSTQVTAEQRGLALEAIAATLALLPDLRAVVLVGATARRVWDRGRFEPPSGARLYRSDHPSPQVRAGYRARWNAIPESWPDREALE